LVKGRPHLYVVAGLAGWRYSGGFPAGGSGKFHSESWFGGGGGGRSQASWNALTSSVSMPFAIAAGGGGTAGREYTAGAGGGLYGQSGTAARSGSGATPFSGGRTGYSSLYESYPNTWGGLLRGGNGYSESGGGGDGFFGGGGGYSQDPGGGGSSFLSPDEALPPSNTYKGSYSQPHPAALSDPDYPGNNVSVGVQSAYTPSYRGNDGFAVVIIYEQDPTGHCGLVTDLVSSLPFLEMQSNTVSDVVRADAHGVLTSWSTSARWTWAPGPREGTGAIEFLTPADGQIALMTMAGPRLNLTTDFTVSFSVKPTVAHEADAAADNATLPTNSSAGFQGQAFLIPPHMGGQAQNAYGECV
jgi:hypothetical protein